MLKLNNHNRQLGPLRWLKLFRLTIGKKGGRSLRVETPAWLCEGEERLYKNLPGKFF
jgi:hypothetical protein